MSAFRNLNLIVALISIMTLRGDLAKSGPEIGSFPADFQVWDVTGPNAGRSLNYRIEFGAEPVACIFTRNMDAPVTKLVEKLDAQIAKNSVLKSFLVLMTANDNRNEDLLKNAAKTRGIKSVPLTISGKTEGPKGYRIAPEAEITVVFWSGGQVRAVHAFAQGDLSDEKIQKVLEEIPKILR